MHVQSALTSDYFSSLLFLADGFVDLFVLSFDYATHKCFALLSCDANCILILPSLNRSYHTYRINSYALSVIFQKSKSLLLTFSGWMLWFMFIALLHSAWYTWASTNPAFLTGLHYQSWNHPLRYCEKTLSLSAPWSLLYPQRPGENLLIAKKSEARAPD